MLRMTIYGGRNPKTGATTRWIPAVLSWRKKA
jgi:hypothetical protein